MDTFVEAWQPPADFGLDDDEAGELEAEERPSTSCGHGPDRSLASSRIARGTASSRSAPLTPTSLRPERSGEHPAGSIDAVDAAEVLAQLRADQGLREMARALLLGDELLRLPELSARLADGQAKLEAAVERLTEGQARLFEGQAKLEAAVERLTEGQARLFEGQDRLRKEMGSLSNTIGGTAEEDAADVVEYVARERGLRLLAPPMATDLDGDGELDLWARVADADGNELSILVEAKVRLRAREVRAWAARLEDPAYRRSLVDQGIVGPYLAYAFGIRIYAEAREAARSLGVGVLSARGEDVPPVPIASSTSRP